METKFNIVFKRLKEAKLDENILCSEFWRKIIALSKKFNEKDCWDLTVENIEWLINTNTITTDDLISWFTEEELVAHNIFVSGHHEIKDDFAIGIKTAVIEAVGHSKIILFDHATCEAYDTSFVKVFNNSIVHLNNCVADAFHNSRVIAKDFSKVEAWDDVKVIASGYSCILAHDNVQVQNSENTHTVIV